VNSLLLESHFLGAILLEQVFLNKVCWW